MGDHNFNIVTARLRLLPRLTVMLSVYIGYTGILITESTGLKIECKGQ